MIKNFFIKAVIIISLILPHTLLPLKASAATLSEVETVIGGILPLLNHISIRNMLGVTRGIENLLIGDTIYDVQFKRGFAGNVLTDYFVGDITTTPFWNDPTTAKLAADAIMAALGRTTTYKDDFAVLAGEEVEKADLIGDSIVYTVYTDIYSESADDELCELMYIFDESEWSWSEPVDKSAFYQANLSEGLDTLDESIQRTAWMWAVFSEPEAIEVAARLGYEPLPDPPDTVPEPATIFLFALGLIGLAGVNRRKYFSHAN